MFHFGNLILKQIFPFENLPNLKIIQFEQNGRYSGDIFLTLKASQSIILQHIVYIIIKISYDLLFLNLNILYKATPLHKLLVCVIEELPKAKKDKEKFKLNLLRDGILFQLVVVIYFAVIAYLFLL